MPPAPPPMTAVRWAPQPATPVRPARRIVATPPVAALRAPRRDKDVMDEEEGERGFMGGAYLAGSSVRDTPRHSVELYSIITGGPAETMAGARPFGGPKGG